jgi:signal transduction histidine kinase
MSGSRHDFLFASLDRGGVMSVDKPPLALCVQADLPFGFDRFYRAQDARKLPGSGLGLAIVRQAAEACGGFTEANNAPGGGALLRVAFGEVARPRLEAES